VPSYISGEEVTISLKDYDLAKAVVSFPDRFVKIFGYEFDDPFDDHNMNDIVRTSRYKHASAIFHHHVYILHPAAPRRYAYYLFRTYANNVELWKDVLDASKVAEWIEK